MRDELSAGEGDVVPRRTAQSGGDEETLKGVREMIISTRAAERVRGASKESAKYGHPPRFVQTTIAPQAPALPYSMGVLLPT